METIGSLKRCASDQARAQTQRKRPETACKRTVGLSFCVVFLQLKIPKALTDRFGHYVMTAKMPKVHIFVPYLVLRMQTMLGMKMMNKCILFVALIIG